MSKRNKIIIISLIVLAIAALVAFIVWLFFGNQPEPVVPENPSEINVPVVLPGSSSSKSEVLAEPTAENLDVSLRSLAASFAERFGSYSNQGNFNNLEDLRGLMTLRMDAWADNYIANQKSLVVQGYYGVTTVAVSSKITDLNDEVGQATVIVSTQKQETKGTTANPRVTYQDIEIELVKTEQGWKVDAVAWQ